MTKYGNMSIFMCICVGLCIYMSKHVYVYDHDCFMYAHNYTHILRLLYDYVQRCEDTVNVELR